MADRAKHVHGADHADGDAAADLVWNFSYGANMNSKTLTGRRNIRPVKSVAGYVDDWCCSFDYVGLPFKEPCYARAQKCAGAQIHGVLHLMTRADLVQLQRTEGGGGGDSGYLLELVEAHTQEGETVQAYILAAAQCSVRQKAGTLPSQRYLNLVIEGARSHHVDAEYVAWLQSVRTFKGTRAAGPLFVVFMLVCMPMWLWYLAIRANFCGLGRRTEKVFWRALPTVIDLLWALADLLPLRLYCANPPNELEQSPPYFPKKREQAWMKDL